MAKFKPGDVVINGDAYWAIIERIGPSKVWTGGDCYHYLAVRWLRPRYAPRWEHPSGDYVESMDNHPLYRLHPDPEACRLEYMKALFAGEIV